MTLQKAQQILSDMRACYEKIATHFVETRKKSWSDGRALAEYVPYCSRVLDVGCGSGRFFEALQRRRVTYIGMDYCESIIAHAKHQYALAGAQFVAGEATSIPCKDEYFDAVTALAVLHHIPGETLQQKAMSECARVLKKGGILVLTVWNLHATYFQNKFGLSATHFEHPSDGLDKGDCFIPWKDEKGTILCMRYVHAFTKDELVKLVTDTGVTLRHAWYMRYGVYASKHDGLNVVIVAKK